MFAPWKEDYDKFRLHIRKQRYQFADKGPYSCIYDFSNSHVWMWELDQKENWTLKDWWFWTVTLEKTLESPLDCKKIKPVNPKEISSEYSLEGLMLKLKLQYFGNMMQRIDSLEKTLMLGRVESRKRRGQQRMRWLDGITTGWTWIWASSGIVDGQGSLACYSPWGCTESDTTELLKWTELS